MSTTDAENTKVICPICRRPAAEWFVKIAIEDTAGFRQEAFICANCGVKLRLASEKARDLQIDPWIHEAFARILRGKDEKEE
ncbi:MAG TPA: hypothetical protein VMA09_04520 [Candidatus Binataceae bacterium]|nr:hypothetical protein [Candidatus Binataceae bacterium]